jgi:hypothetical protein
LAIIARVLRWPLGEIKKMTLSEILQWVDLAIDVYKREHGK